jgi:hypothetical protein
VVDCDCSCELVGHSGLEPEANGLRGVRLIPRQVRGDTRFHRRNGAIGIRTGGDWRGQEGTNGTTPAWKKVGRDALHARLERRNHRNQRMNPTSHSSTPWPNREVSTADKSAVPQTIASARSHSDVVPTSVNNLVQFLARPSPAKRPRSPPHPAPHLRSEAFSGSCLCKEIRCRS